MNQPQGEAVFIVGNSRSGTTLASKILGLNSKIFSYEELHFFEQMWHPGDGSQELGPSEAVELGARLIGTARVGRLLLQSTQPYLNESAEMLAGLSRATPTAVYQQFLEYGCRRSGKQIPCEQTPRYVFYAREILEVFPEARIMVMVRDPRAIMLSQKNKWKQYKSGRGCANSMELIRSWSNYHPILLSRMWSQSINAGNRVRADDRVKYVYFEELLQHPERVSRDICSFVGVDFEEGMLQVAESKSVLAQADSNNQGISSAPAERWKASLKAVDLYWCQKIAGQTMMDLGYTLVPVRVNLLAVAFSFLMFPVKAMLALLFNFRQSRNLLGSIRRRLLSS